MIHKIIFRNFAKAFRKEIVAYCAAVGQEDVLMLAETPSICLTENLELAIAEVQELLLDGNPDDGMKLLVIFIDDSG